MKLKILYIIHIYNEIDFLPYKVRWCRQNGLGIHILDNYSTDGSWEYLQKNKISCERVNTDGTFHLAILQKATNNALLRINPHWVVYLGMDTFTITPRPLRDEIASCKCDMMVGPWLNFFNTGEERGNPFKTYFYYSKIKAPIALIFRYHRKAQIFADEVLYRIPKKVVHLPGAYVNFGNTKPKEQRIDTLNRRKKAWMRGLNRVWGTHYPVYNKQGWQWEKRKLKDIRESEYWELHKKLWSL